MSAFILSPIDYCNAVLAGLPASTRALLQRGLNAAARVVAGTAARANVICIMKSLHWLRIAYRIRFKLCPHARREAMERVQHTCQTALHRSRQCLAIVGFALRQQLNEFDIPRRAGLRHKLDKLELRARLIRTPSNKSKEII